jgi:hypothetical protein
MSTEKLPAWMTPSHCVRLASVLCGPVYGPEGVALPKSSYRADLVSNGLIRESRPGEYRPTVEGTELMDALVADGW